MRKKLACISVKNKNEACFACSIVLSLHPVDNHSDRMSKYPHYSTVLNLEGLTFPIILIQIPKFGKNNNISVNVYVLEMNMKTNFIDLPVYLTKHKQNIHINLLLIVK